MPSRPSFPKSQPTISNRLHQNDSPSLTQTDIKKAYIAIAQSVGKTLWHWLIRSSEPIVSERRDYDGAHYYQVYDPVNEEIYRFASEDETRIWLEQRK